MRLLSTGAGGGGGGGGGDAGGGVGGEGVGALPHDSSFRMEVSVGSRIISTALSASSLPSQVDAAGSCLGGCEAGVVGASVSPSVRFLGRRLRELSRDLRCGSFLTDRWRPEERLGPRAPSAPSDEFSVLIGVESSGAVADKLVGGRLERARGLPRLPRFFRLLFATGAATTFTK